MQISTYNFRFERWLNLPGLNLHPIDHLEEEVVLDLLLPLLHAPQPLARVLHQKLNQVNRYSLPKSPHISLTPLQISLASLLMDLG